MSTERTPANPATPLALPDEALEKATGGGKPASDGQPQQGSGDGSGTVPQPFAAM